MQTIELSPAEQELIAAKRAEEQAVAERQAAEEARREEKRVAEVADRRNNKLSKIAYLRSEDENGLLFQTEKGGDERIFFLLDGHEEEIVIENHHVSTSNGWRSRNAGMKYKLYGNFNNYSQRYYKNPKTVIKKIREFQATALAKRTRKETATELKTDAEAALNRMYPDAKVEHKAGYDYSSRNRINRQPDHFVVSTKNGSVEFTYHREEGKLKFPVRARKPSKLVAEQVTALILG